MTSDSSDPASHTPPTDPAAGQGTQYLIDRESMAGTFLDASQLRALLAVGLISTEDYVWAEDMPDWQPLGSVLNFSADAPTDTAENRKAEAKNGNPGTSSPLPPATPPSPQSIAQKPIALHSRPHLQPQGPVPLPASQPSTPPAIPHSASPASVDMGAKKPLLSLQPPPVPLSTHVTPVPAGLPPIISASPPPGPVGPATFGSPVIAPLPAFTSPAIPQPGQGSSLPPAPPAPPVPLPPPTVAQSLPPTHTAGTAAGKRPRLTLFLIIGCTLLALVVCFLGWMALNLMDRIRLTKAEGNTFRANAEATVQIDPAYYANIRKDIVDLRAGRVKVYDGSQEKLSSGQGVSLHYPQSWTAEESSSPSILQEFHGETPPYLCVYYGIDPPAAEPMTREVIRQMLSDENVTATLQQSFPEAIIISQSARLIAGQPAVTVDWLLPFNEAGVSSLQLHRSIFFYKDAARHQLTMTMEGAKEDEPRLKAEMQTAAPLLDEMADSIQLQISGRNSVQN